MLSLDDERDRISPVLNDQTTSNNILNCFEFEYNCDDEENVLVIKDEYKREMFQNDGGISKVLQFVAQRSLDIFNAGELESILFEKKSLINKHEILVPFFYEFVSLMGRMKAVIYPIFIRETTKEKSDFHYPCLQQLRLRAAKQYLCDICDPVDTKYFSVITDRRLVDNDICENIQRIRFLLESKQKLFLPHGFLAVDQCSSKATLYTSFSLKTIDSGSLLFKEGIITGTATKIYFNNWNEVLDEMPTIMVNNIVCLYCLIFSNDSFPCSCVRSKPDESFTDLYEKFMLKWSKRHQHYKSKVESCEVNDSCFGLHNIRLKNGQPVLYCNVNFSDEKNFTAAKLCLLEQEISNKFICCCEEDRIKYKAKNEKIGEDKIIEFSKFLSNRIVPIFCEFVAGNEAAIQYCVGSTDRKAVDACEEMHTENIECNNEIASHESFEAVSDDKPTKKRKRRKAPNKSSNVENTEDDIVFQASDNQNDNCVAEKKRKSKHIHRVESASTTETSVNATIENSIHQTSDVNISEGNETIFRGIGKKLAAVKFNSDRKKAERQNKNFRSKSNHLSKCIENNDQNDVDNCISLVHLLRKCLNSRYPTILEKLEKIGVMNNETIQRYIQDPNDALECRLKAEEYRVFNQALVYVKQHIS